MTWNPELYARFQSERAQPFHDLMARVPTRHYQRIADLGCGTGTHTRWLAAQHPHAEVIGVDSSADMLGAADDTPDRVTYVQQDLGEWRAAVPVDLIVSNAALHWLPDHPRLIPHLLESLADPGVLAFQVPANQDEPAHRAVADVALDPHWADIVQPRLAPGSVLPLADYRALLDARGLTIDAWDTVYTHRLPGVPALIEWLSGTTLHAALAALDPGDADEFRERLGNRLAAAYGDGDIVTFPFRRRFVVATTNQTA